MPVVPSGTVTAVSVGRGNFLKAYRTLPAKTGPYSFAAYQAVPSRARPLMLIRLSGNENAAAFGTFSNASALMTAVPSAMVITPLSGTAPS